MDFSDVNNVVDVTSVADQIRNAHKLPPLTEDQRQQRLLEMEAHWLEQQRQSEQRRIERERRQTLAQERARQEAQAARAEANRRHRLEREERIGRETAQRELRDLRLQVTRQGSWQHAVESAAQNAEAFRRRLTLLNELEALVSPPAPPPESVDESDDDIGEPVSWFHR
jgi:hypothetical protein